MTFFGSARDQEQSLVHATQEFYHWTTHAAMTELFLCRQIKVIFSVLKNSEPSPLW